MNEAASVTKESSNIDTEKLLKKIIALDSKRKNIIYQMNAFSVMSLHSVTAKTSWIINASVGNTGARGNPKPLEKGRRLASARFLFASIDALAHSLNE